MPSPARRKGKGEKADSSPVWVWTREDIGQVSGPALLVVEKRVKNKNPLH